MEPGALFIARLKQPMSRNAMRLTIASLAESAGVTAACHDFRRACAARLLREGVSADDVARQLGHTSITMTLIYGEEGRTERAIAAFHAADQGVRPMRKAR